MTVPVADFLLLQDRVKALEARCRELKILTEDVHRAAFPDQHTYRDRYRCELCATGCACDDLCSCVCHD